MRTTLTIDDNLAAALKKRAFKTGRSFKDVVNEALRLGLDADRALPRPRPYRVKPASLGKPLPGVDLTRANRLAGDLEDEEYARKMELRK